MPECLLLFHLHHLMCHSPCHKASHRKCSLQPQVTFRSAMLDSLCETHTVVECGGCISGSVQTWHGRDVPGQWQQCAGSGRAMQSGGQHCDLGHPSAPHIRTCCSPCLPPAGCYHTQGTPSTPMPLCPAPMPPCPTPMPHPHAPRACQLSPHWMFMSANTVPPVHVIHLVPRFMGMCLL